MATYDYKCFNEKCEKYDLVFEVKQSMKDDKLTVCEHCKTPSLERLITNKTSTIFSGNGWIKNGGQY